MPKLRSLLPLALLFVPFALHAATIASVTGGSTPAGSDNYAGQSFTTASGSSFDDITFSFLTSSNTPYALGTGFLLSSQYLGSPASLSSSTASFLGSAGASGGVYTFAPTLTLVGGTQYYFYENALIPNNSFQGYLSTPNGNFSFSLGSFAPFVAVPSTADYIVTGAAVPTSATPEPSSFVLLGTGLLGFAGAVRRKLTT